MVPGANMDEDRLGCYRKLAALFGLTVKGKANPYTAINGNMFTFLDKSGVLCLRLPKAEREVFMQAHGTGPVEQYGTVMKEYVSVPEAMLSDEALLRVSFAQSLDYARSLKPKPTKR